MEGRADTDPRGATGVEEGCKDMVIESQAIGFVLIYIYLNLPLFVKICADVK